MMTGNRFFRAILPVLLWGLAAMPSAAQEPASRDITRATMVGVGGTNLLETYLSPEKYAGTAWRVMQHVTLANSSHPLWTRQMVNEVSVSSSRNRADNASYLSAFYHFEYDWHRRLAAIPLWKGMLRLKAGPGADAMAGFVYSTRNGNNPAQAHFGMMGTASFVADYALPKVQSRWWRWIVPVAFHYELQLPLLGLQFSPNFGQSYYEIFTQGNYDHNLIVATPFNAPSVRQMLTADFRLSPHSALRVGYRGDCQQSKFNQLKFHDWSHLFIIGFVKSFTINHRPL